MKLYLDTNAYLDLFENRQAGLLEQIQAVVGASRVTIVASEVGFTEVLEGSHLPTFATGVESFFAIHPRWIYLTGMPAREVIFAYDQQFQTPDGIPGTLLGWGELLPLISEPLDLSTIPDLAIPTVAALHAFLPPGVVGDRMKYWKEQLKRRQANVIRMLANGSKHAFYELVAFILRMPVPEAREFADALFADPDRAPAFRLQFELDLLTANTTKPKWLKNDFFDFLHAGVLPHVDCSSRAMTHLWND